jgi:endoglucanase
MLEQRLLSRASAFQYLLLAAVVGSWSASALFPVTAAVETPFARGDTVISAEFEDTNPLARWEGSGRLEPGYASQHALAVERRQDTAARSTVLLLPLPVERMRGCTIRATAMVKAEHVSVKPNAWNGIKFMLPLESPAGRLWPQAEIGTGSFDWKRVAFTTRIPATATKASLLLGLEEVGGKVWFDNVKIVVAKPPVLRPAGPITSIPFKGHNLPRLRGAMVSPSIDAESLRLFGRDWNANLIRWQLVRHGRPGQPSSLAEYDQWLEGELGKLDAALPICRQSGLYVVVDLHSPPGGKATSGGYTGSDDRLFSDPACQRRFVKVWEHIARRYQGTTAIWGFDLANEPVEGLVEEGCDDWQALAERTAQAIRAIDPHRTLIVEPASWGGPDGFNDLVPLTVSNVVYSVHMYVPHSFTHQGVFQAGREVRYPGPIDGQAWDKARLEAVLQPVIDFQKAYGVAIYVGEFSAIRWAPDQSAFRYLKDLVDIFEEHGWDWSYHAFREWSGWSVEHSEDRLNTDRASAPTERQRLLRSWFAKNQKPPWTDGSR